MPKLSRPRRGSLQFWPRKRARKLLPSANWKQISSKKPGLLGFIAYKAGMVSVQAKDLTDKVRTSGKTITLPATVLEVPNMKILSVRFYNEGKVVKDVLTTMDKELKRKLKIPKTLKDIAKEIPEKFDDIRAIVFSISKQTGIKKTPDIIEVAIQGQNANAKLEFLKPLLNKEITLEDFSHDSLIDIRAVTKGKGTQGPVKRFGITLRFHKSEKGVRKVGSIAPWHPARVTYQTPMAGQMGLFTRVIYNVRIISQGKNAEKDINPRAGFKNFGKIQSSYILIKGSVQGPAKRQVLLTAALRPSKKQLKQKLELQEVFL